MPNGDGVLKQRVFSIIGNTFNEFCLRNEGNRVTPELTQGLATTIEIKLTPLFDDRQLEEKPNDGSKP